MGHSRAFPKFFWVDVGIEWGLIGVAVFALARVGRGDLIPQALGVIIGLHFLPLVKIFRAPLYYWTGGIMVVATLGSLLMHRGYLRNVFTCAAVGLTLWVTSLAVLCRTSAALGDNPNRTYGEPADDVVEDSTASPDVFQQKHDTGEPDHTEKVFDLALVNEWRACETSATKQIAPSHASVSCRVATARPSSVGVRHRAR